jgi:hypothetical protein
MTQAVTLAQAGNSNGTFRNKIINGAMVIDQRNAGAAITSSNYNGNVYCTDRWNAYANVASKISIQQSTSAPGGFTNSLLITSASAYTLGAGELQSVRQFIEGYNFADIGWGTSSAKPVTVSFWVQSSLTGTFSGHIQNAAQTYTYIFTYNITVANTWQYVTVTIPGQTSGAWPTNNTAACQLTFMLGSGATYGSGTANAWQTGNIWAAAGSVSLVAVNNATWQITGVQLEIGTVPTAFELRSYSKELMMCQRYFQLTNPSNQYAGGGLVGSGQSSGYCGTSYSFPVVMRATPSVTRGGTRDTWYVAGISSNASAAINGSNYYYSPTSIFMEVGTFSPSIITGFFAIYNGQLSISAEL